MPREPKLTERDKVWIRELAEGKSLKELTGAKLSSVRNRLFRLRHLFGARTNEQLMVILSRRGLIQ